MGLVALLSTLLTALAKMAEAAAERWKFKNATYYPEKYQEVSREILALKKEARALITAGADAVLIDAVNERLLDAVKYKADLSKGRAALKGGDAGAD